MKHIVVIANETAASRSLADLIEEKAKDRDVYVTVVAPVNQPRQGYVVYYDTRRAAARRRLDRTLSLLREHGISATGVVVECDPVSALRDALDQLEPDEVIVSTHPPERSRWLEHGVLERARREVPLPITHVIVDLDAEAAGTAA
jgi:GABA permease